MNRAKPISLGAIWSSATNGRKTIGILGCGVEKSRLPHCEHVWAERGFEWRRPQSFTLKLEPQQLQKTGSPSVSLWQRWQYFTAHLRRAAEAGFLLAGTRWTPRSLRFRSDRILKSKKS